MELNGLNEETEMDEAKLDAMTALMRLMLARLDRIAEATAALEQYAREDADAKAAAIEKARAAVEQFVGQQQ